MCTPPNPSDRDLTILRSGLLAEPERSYVATSLGMSTARLLQAFNLLIDDPAAAEAEPEIVERAQRIRARRRAARSIRPGMRRG